MFEQFTFENIMSRMLSNVKDKMDKREGSVVYDALAPAALELANFYTYLDMIVDESFADTASYYFLVRRAQERGIYPQTATYAVCKMVVSPVDTVIVNGDRFNFGTLNYAVTSAIEGEQGAYEVLCETLGTAGNQPSGTLLPIEYIEGLQTAELTEVLIPGEDDEDMEAFRERYLTSFDSQAFGGNQADYTEKVNAINGVGGCRIIRQWEQGYSPSAMIPSTAATAWVNQQSADTIGAEPYTWLKKVHDAAAQKLLTVGGTIKILIITSDFTAPSSALIKEVQTAIDPEQNAGEGEGIAPIGHVVNVVGVQKQTINFDFDIVYVRDFSFEDVKSSVETVIDNYLLGLAQQWDSNIPLVRTNQLETLLLEIEGIADITQTRMNGQTANLTIDVDYIPVRGEVSG